MNELGETSSDMQSLESAPRPSAAAHGPEPLNSNAFSETQELRFDRFRLREWFLQAFQEARASSDSPLDPGLHDLVQKEADSKQPRFLLPIETEYKLLAQAEMMSASAAVEHLSNALGISKHVRLPSQSFDEVRVLTQNVWGVPRVIGGKLPRRHEYTAAVLDQSDFGIVALQEMWSRSTRPLLEMESFPYQAHGPRLNGMWKSNGLVTLSRYPIVESENLFFKVSRGIERHARKGALFTRVALPSGRSLDVYNVHLISSTTLLPEDRANPVRAAQLEELNEWIEARRQPGVPVLVLGDFNIDSNGRLYNQMRSLLGEDLYSRRNHQDITGEPVETERKLGYTFDPEQNYWARTFWASKSSVMRKRLDYIFLDGLSPLEFSVASNIEFQSEKYLGLPVSDHFGVSAHIRWFEQSKSFELEQRQGVN